MADDTRLSSDVLQEQVKAHESGEQTSLLQHLNQLAAPSGKWDALWHKIREVAFVFLVFVMVYLFGISTGVLLAEREQRVTIKTWTEALHIMSRRGGIEPPSSRVGTTTGALPTELPPPK